MRKIRHAVIGLGMGHHHVKAISGVNEMELLAVCDSDEAKLGEFRKAGLQVFTDWRKLVHMNDLDSVSVCLPNYLHVPVSRAFLKARKHVLCEKPLARTAKEALTLRDAVRSSGSKFMMAYNQRFREDTRFLKKQIVSGKFGDIYYGRAVWVRRCGRPHRGWFTQKAQSGGGPLIDIGVHVIDLAIWLMGWPKVHSVTAETYPKTPRRDSLRRLDVEDWAAGFIRFKNGAALAVEVSWVSEVEKETIHLQLVGSKAGAELNPMRIYAYHGGRPATIDFSSFGKDFQHIDWLKTVQDEQRHFACCILQDRKPECGYEEGLTLMKILDAMYASSAKGREIRIT